MNEIFKKEQAQINRALKKYLPKDNSSLSSAMRYSVFAGGKRFRPALMLITGELLKCNAAKIIPAACAVENPSGVIAYTKEGKFVRFLGK